MSPPPGTIHAEKHVGGDILQGDQSKLLRLGVATLLLVLGVLGAVESFRMGNPLHQTVGPAVFPFVLSVVLVFCGCTEVAVLMVASSRQRFVGRQASGRWLADPKPVGVALALVAGLVVWNTLGYVPAVFCIITAVVLIGGTVRPTVAFLYGSLCCLSLWALFGLLLGMRLQ